MPRASRYLVEGYTYHLTHRCHDQRFLLKFSEERDEYREWLRKGIKRYGVAVYGYCITNNHVHVVAHVDDCDAVARMMQLSAGAVARHLNRRKGHESSVWEHPYQCTIIQDGRHLLNCLRYVDLNMVRAGVVAHPREWRWCGYDELTGVRKRYCLIDLQRLLQSLDLNDESDFVRLYSDGMQDLLAGRALARDAVWTESLAVGSRDFIDGIKKEYTHRIKYEEHCIDGVEQGATWAVRESQVSYMADSRAKKVI